MKIFNNVLVVVLTVLFTLGITQQVAFAAGPGAVSLGSSGNFVILAKTGISTTGATAITGDLGLSPAAASYITGFALSLPAASAFSTSALVTGKIYAPGYADPTPANLTTAVLDMQNAYTDAAGRASTVTELGAGNIGGLTLAPGVYKWGTGVTIPTNVTLSGGANDVWIFQIAQNLGVSPGVHIVLAGGAQAANIFWQVAGQTTLGTTSIFNGNILDQTAIVFNTGAVLNGRALAQTAVTLDANAVAVPAVSVSVIPVTPAIPIVPVVTPVVPGTVATPVVSATNSMVSAPLVTAAVSENVVTAATPAPSVSVVSSQNTTDRATALAQIMTRIYAIQAELSAKGAMVPSVNAVAKANVNARFMRDTAVGSMGGDVRALQQWLNGNGYEVAATGPGSAGNETTTFGGLTRAALMKFQAKVGISPALGNFGAVTRAYLSTRY